MKENKEENALTLDLNSTLCLYCRWKINVNSCKAYENIPKEVFYQFIDHRNPYKGDNGITFEPKRACELCKHKEAFWCLAYRRRIEDLWEDKNCPSFELNEERLNKLVGEKRPLPDPESIELIKESLKYIQI